MTRNRILVVGNSGVEKLNFVKKLFQISCREFPQSQVTHDLEVSDGKCHRLRIPWLIDTKYYTAEVEFLIEDVHIDKHREMAQTYKNPNDEIGQTVDAFIYMCSKDDLGTFQGIRDWLTFLEDCDPGIRVCVADGTAEEEVEAIESWCIDNQFEYIDMTRTTDIAFDKAGADLALEVLQTNMWDGMTRKDNVSAAKNLKTEEQEQLYKEMADLKLNSKQDEEKKKFLFNESDAEEGNEDDTEFLTDEDVRFMQKELFGSISEEDGLDKAFEALQAIRDKGRTLSDSERRKLAAQVALSFAAELEL
ncbi:hypothetical protein EC973_005524 [Apophysomyces ossiformis]|uniref:Uncharacterized protein n=1 Tax=Apophysomyces ossiformis TaxID=679940 RepID=A0A8H7BKB7_9FUNG|nr:hypothetical protein EC973_005524 [Apophysomyces ossiformis]